MKYGKSMFTDIVFKTVFIIIGAVFGLMVIAFNEPLIAVRGKNDGHPLTVVVLFSGMMVVVLIATRHNTIKQLGAKMRHRKSAIPVVYAFIGVAIGIFITALTHNGLSF